ncbi:MAG: transposase, partial [Planctomycetota bacterium]
MAGLDSTDVIYVADDRKKSTLSGFYKSLTPEQIGAIECVTMDMCKAYISSTKKHVPDAEA